MYIIDIIPLALIPRNQPQILSYFHDTALQRGAVVEVELNRRKVRGVVIGCDTLKNRKLNFKKNVDFELKNISEVINLEPMVADWQLMIAQRLSNYYYAPFGICLKTVLPPFWGKKLYPFSPQIINTAAKIITPGFYFDYEDKIRHYIKLGNQVFLMVPENALAQYFAKKYSQLNPIIISGSLPNKKIYEVWQKVSEKGPRLIIGTRIGLFLPFSNLGLLVVDDESNEAYKSDMMPRYFAPDLAIEVAKLRGAEIILSSPVPRVETFHKYKPRFLHKIPQQKIVNMVDEIRAANFTIFSRELQESIYENLSPNIKIILYIPRRGHANFILCQHCGETIKCPNCATNLVQHLTEKEIELRCHHCNHVEIKPKNCPFCGAYKLKAYGIGIEKVMDDLKKLLKRAQIQIPKILLLDSERVKTEEKESKIIDEFMEIGGPIVLLTTQKIFSYKYSITADLNPKPIIGIITTDTLINIPDFRSQENIFRQIYMLGQIADKLIIQTHNPEDFALKYAAEGDPDGFYSTELRHREQFSYPPFSRFVKLTFRHKNPVIAKREAFLLLNNFHRTLIVKKSEIEIIGPMPAFISRERGLYIWNILLKIKNWVDIQNQETLTEQIKTRNGLLRVVPSGWIIDVDPRSII